MKNISTNYTFCHYHTTICVTALRPLNSGNPQTSGDIFTQIFIKGQKFVLLQTCTHILEYANITPVNYIWFGTTGLTLSR